MEFPREHAPFAKQLPAVAHLGPGRLACNSPMRRTGRSPARPAACSCWASSSSPCWQPSSMSDPARRCRRRSAWRPMGGSRSSRATRSTPREPEPLWSPAASRDAPSGAATPVFSHDGTRIAWKRLGPNNPSDDPTLYGDLVRGEYRRVRNPIVVETGVTGMSPTAWSPDDREVLWDGHHHRRS